MLKRGTTGIAPQHMANIQLTMNCILQEEDMSMLKMFGISCCLQNKSVPNLVQYRSVTYGSKWVKPMDIKTASIWELSALAQVVTVKEPP
jgi:hypothetical protein